MQDPTVETQHIMTLSKKFVLPLFFVLNSRELQGNKSHQLMNFMTLWKQVEMTANEFADVPGQALGAFLAVSGTMCSHIMDAFLLTQCMSERSNGVQTCASCV